MAERTHEHVVVIKVPRRVDKWALLIHLENLALGMVPTDQPEWMAGSQIGCRVGSYGEVRWQRFAPKRAIGCVSKSLIHCC